MYRMRLLFTRGPFFYAEYNFRLLLFLLFRRAAVLHSNDLDTLPANYLAAKLKGAELVYDSHEYFTEVPELEHNAFAKKTWKRIERNIVPRLKYCITVNQSIADLFYRDYKKTFMVMRNVPMPAQTVASRTREELGMPVDKKILILQGSGINIHRGAEELVEALSLLDDQYCLYIIGSGDVIHLLQCMTDALKIEHKIIFLPRQPYDAMMQYTANADLGLTLDKDTNINYRYSLPNKIFDYIQAGIPVLASDLPEIRRVVNHYNIGKVLSEVTPECIARNVAGFLDDTESVTQARNNTRTAAAELNWENEKKVLIDIYRQLV